MDQVFFTYGAVAFWTASVCLLITRLLLRGVFKRYWLLALGTTLQLIAGVGMSLQDPATASGDRFILVLIAFSQPFLVGTTLELFGDAFSGDWLEQNRKATTCGIFVSLACLAVTLGVVHDETLIAQIARTACQAYSALAALAITITLGVVVQLGGFSKNDSAGDAPRLRAFYILSVGVNLLYFGISDQLTKEQDLLIRMLAVTSWAVVNLIGVFALTGVTTKTSVSPSLEVE